MRNPRLLVAVGVLVVAAGIGFYYVYNTSQLSGRDVGGAIGVVEKHRDTQITASDVILGDEKFRNEAETLYAGFLADAAALETRSVALGIFARGLGAKEQNFEAFRAEAQSFDRELASRYADAGEEALGMVDMLMKQELLEAFNRDFQGMRQDLAIVDKLEMKQLQVREQQLGRIAADVAARAGEANELAVMTRDMQGIVDRVESREAKLDVRQLGVMQADLRKMETELELQRALDVRMIESRIDRLAARFRELRTLMQARQEFAAIETMESFRAEALEAREQELLEVSKGFVGIAESLEGRAMINMKERIAELSARAEQFAGLRAELMELRKGLDYRAETMDVRAMQEAVASFDNALEMQRNQLGSRIAETMQADLSVIERHFDTHAQLQARMRESMAGAEAEGLEGRAQAEQELGLVADLQGIRHQLTALTRDIETNAFVKAEARTRLSTRAQEMQAKSANL